MMRDGLLRDKKMPGGGCPERYTTSFESKAKGISPQAAHFSQRFFRPDGDKIGRNPTDEESDSATGSCPPPANFS